MTAETNRGERWVHEAEALGVDPHEPDDSKYWSEIDRKRGVLDSFKYHQPSEDQVARIAAIRNAHVELARLIMRSTGTCADQTAALRKLHECMMTCNKAIVCEKA